jgi:glutaredoxin 3
MSLTLYGKSNCPFCDKAKALLTMKGVDFTVVKIDEDNAAREFLLTEGHRSVPQIYKDGKLFVEGGFQGLQKLPDEELKNA